MYPHVQQFETRRIMVEDQLQRAQLKARRKPEKGISRWSLTRLTLPAARRSINDRLA